MVEAFGPFLSAFLTVVFDRIARRELMAFFSKNDIDEELLEKLETLLMSVTAVLADAEEKEAVDPFLKAWVDKLKEIIYYADDMLDDIITKNLCSSESQPSIENQLRDIVSSLNPFSEGIKRKTRKIIDTLQMLVDQKDILGIKENSLKKLPLLSMPTTSLVDESEIHGRQGDKEKIIDFLLSGKVNEEEVKEEEEVPVVAIVGVPGIGKTTLAQLLYNDEGVKKHFSLRSWVYTSEGMNVCEITKKIYECVSTSQGQSQSQSHCHITDLNLLQLKLKKIVEGTMFLIVLDNFWIDEFLDWDVLKKPFSVGVPGSRIIVTSRRFTVASTLRASLTHPLSYLSDDDCWKLFVYYAFKSRNPDAYPTLERVGQQIVEKCGGLPIAAKVLGSFLHPVADVEEWDHVLNREIWDLPDDSISLLPVIRLGYSHLSSHLKRCFAYCCIYPKGYEIEKWHLISLWMAEGLLPQPKSGERIEDVGNKYIKELLSRSFLQTGTKESCFVMPDLIHNLAKHVAGEFTHMQVDSNQYVPAKVRHLSYLQDMFTDGKHLEVFLKAKNLRTFLPFNFSTSISVEHNTGAVGNKIVDKLLPELKSLRAFSLSYYALRSLPDSIGNLKHLRYLNLSYTRISELPYSVGSLYNLETLLLSNCVFLGNLPSNLCNLVNLRHLDIRETKLSEMPVDLGKLEALQVLTAFFASRGSGSKINELGKLSGLHDSLSLMNLQNVIEVNDALEADLKSKKHLVSLVFKWTAVDHDIQNETDVLDRLQPHEYLTRLNIENFGGSFPTWLGNPSLPNLVSLEINDCRNCTSLPSLGQLPSLLELRLTNFTSLQRVGPEFYGNNIQPFRSLTIIKFEDMHVWEEWLPFVVEGGEFPSLVELHMERCPLLTGEFPRNLNSSASIMISECPNLEDHQNQ